MKLLDMEPRPTNSILTVAVDMTFPNRIYGGSSVYANSLMAQLKKSTDVSVQPISGPLEGGAKATLQWLLRGAGAEAKRAGADVLHCPAFVAPWRSHLPLVITMHDAAALRFPGEQTLEWRLYNRYFLPAVARRAAAVLVGSESSRSDLMRYYGLASRRVIVTRYGVDELYHRVVEPQIIADERASLMGTGEGALLLFSGAPLPRKNLDMVLRVMSQASDDNILSRSVLVITGATPQEFPRYCDIIAAQGLSDRVAWLGHLPVERLAVTYAAADLLVYPSFYEGFGLPPLEAMASGTPVVASNAQCLPEVLGDAAILVEPADDDGLHNALESVLNDSDLRGRLISKGMDRAALFTWERCAQETIEVYMRVTSAKRVGSVS